MLHKLFKKRSFRRPHKNIDYNNSKGNRENADDSDSFDNSSIIGAASPTTTSNGLSSGPPIATQEEGGVCSETESLKKVTFIEPVAINSGKPSSPDNDKRAVNTDLFDGNVLEAFQTGDISIADFLKTPSQSPKLHAKKKNRSLSDCGPPPTEIWHRMAATTPKKQTLLDRAHSMKTKALPKGNVDIVNRILSGSPAKTITETEALNGNTEDGKSRRENNSSCANGGVASPTPPALNADRKHRFSTSLETLAQEVFGDDEFQRYLAGASSSPVPKKISLTQQTSGELSSNGTITTETEETRHLKLHKPVPLGTKKLESLHVDVSVGTGDSRQKSSISLNSRGENCHKLMHKHSSTCKSLDISAMEVVGALAQNLESWSNNADLSNTSFSSVNSIDDEVTDHLQRMKPIMEGKVDHGPSGLSLDCTSKENSPNEPCPVTTSNQLEFVYRRKIGRLSTSDSQYVNVGSFNDGDGDLDANETSLMDIHFPPPPPVEEGQITPLYMEGYDAQPYHSLPSYNNKQAPSCNGQSFDADSRYAATASPEYHFDFTSDPADPLIESLTSIVPLPDDHEQLVPVLSKALCEIVSEIIASRRKLQRMMKAIEIHQQVLKDQNRQIQKQNKEISELSKTAYALNNLHILSRESMENSSAPNKLHTRSRDSMENSLGPGNLHSSFRESMDNLPVSHNLHSLSRGSLENSPTKALPDPKNRQSREMVELNLTLDKLLYQCSALQTTPRGDSDELLDTDNASRTVFPTSPSIRRVKSCPSRKLKYRKNAIMEDETT